MTAGGSRARAYQLGYTYSPNTGRSLLPKVTRYGTDAQLDGSGTVTAGTALPGQTFTYTPGGVSYSAQSSNGSIGGWDAAS